MAIYSLPSYDFSKHGFSMPLNMERANAFPLDKSAVWTSYTDALNYAKNNPVAYVGQIVTVVNYTPEVKDGETVVTPAKASVDVYKIELGSDGVGTLVKVGAEEAELAVTQLSSQVQTLGGNLTALDGRVTTAEGTLTKAVTDIGNNASSIDALQGTVGDLDTNLTNLSETVADHATTLTQYTTEKANFATKTEVATAKSEAIADAKSETQNQISTMVSQYLTGEGAKDTIDTLQDIVDWLSTEGAGAKKIVADITAIQADYLKNADKTALVKSITDLSTYVGTIPADATSTNVIAYITEVVDALSIGDYAKAKDLTDLAARVKTVEDKVNVIEETTIPGINTSITQINEKNTAIEAKLFQKSTYNDKEEEHTLLTPKQKAILDTLNINDGKVESGLSISIESVTDKDDWIADKLKNLGTANLDAALVQTITGAVREIKLSDDTSIMPTDGVVNIPNATASTLGLVKLGSEFKSDANGVLSIEGINVNKLQQTEGEYLELNGGNATGFDNQ